MGEIMATSIVSSTAQSPDHFNTLSSNCYTHTHTHTHTPLIAATCRVSITRTFTQTNGKNSWNIAVLIYY